MLPPDDSDLPAAERRAVSRTCSCRCTSSSRATGRWWRTRWTATGSSGWCCCGRAGKRTTKAGRRSTRSAAPASSPTPSACRTAATTSCCRGWRSSASSTRTTSRALSRRARRRHPGEQPERDDREAMRTARRRLEALLVPQPAGRGAEPKLPPSMADEDLVNALAQYLELEPVEKQALLERDGLLARCRSLIELLEMKVIVVPAQVEWSGTALTSEGRSAWRAAYRFRAGGAGRYSSCTLLTIATAVPARPFRGRRRSSPRAPPPAGSPADVGRDGTVTASLPIGATAFTPPGPAPPETRSYRSFATGTRSAPRPGPADRRSSSARRQPRCTSRSPRPARISSSE